MSETIYDKTYRFAIRIVKLAILLQNDKKEYVLSKQLMRSGTAPGALAREAKHAQSKKDFIHKMSIGLKEISETNYWLCLLRDTNFSSNKEFNSINSDCISILKILVKIIKTSKENLNSNKTINL